MSLLDAFLLEFETDGLKEIKPEVKQASNELDNFEKKAEKAEKSMKKFDNSALGSIKNLKQLALTAARTIAPFILLGKAVSETMSYAAQALEVAEAAQKAGMSIEAFQKAGGNKYILFTRDDINNAKEFEQTMRDVRMGTASIGANIARMLLPALTTLAKIAKQVVDFFIEHGDLLKASFLAISIAITAAAIPAIISMGRAIWVAMAPLLPFIALAIGLALIFEDLWKWFKGEPSIAELIFGDFESFKNKVMPYFQSMKDYYTAIFRLIKSIFSYLYDKGKPILDLYWEYCKGFYNVIGNIVKYIVDIVSKFIKLQGIFSSLLAKGMNIAADKIDGSHASGLDYVPFDNYRANLHKGEAVLTSSEASDWRSGLLAAKKAISFTANFPLNAIPQGAVSNAYNNATNKVINIGDIVINTQATDGAGIAADLKEYIKNAIISLDDGMLA